jgi:hypothetical protein
MNVHVYEINDFLAYIFQGCQMTLRSSSQTRNLTVSLWVRLKPFVPEHRIAHFWAILSPCYFCCGIGRFYENQNSSNGLYAMGSIFIESPFL